MAKILSTKNDLGYLGENYQYMLVKYLIENPKFFANLSTILDQNMFTDEHLRRIVGIMKDRYSKNGICPSYNDIEVLVRGKITDVITSEIVLEKINKLKDCNFNMDLELLAKNAEKFFKQQNLSKAINQSLDIIRRGNADNYPEIETLIKKALDTNINTDLGFKLFQTLDDDLKEDYRKAIPTGVDVLDQSLYGGLGRGELGLIVSPMGVGKTSVTTGFAAYAATVKNEENNYSGYKVLHLFFEDTEVAIRRKYYGYTTNIDACDLSDPKIKPIAIEILSNNDNELRKMLINNVRLKRLDSGEWSASEIKNLINQYISIGFKPDLVIIDYFECIKPERSIERSGETTWEAEGITMRKFESLAKEFDIALWVPVQSTKSAIGQEYVGLAQAGGSVKKTQIGHVVIQLAQTPEQKSDGKLNMFIGKLRAVRIGRTEFMNIKFNNGTCKFDTSGMDSYGDVDLGSSDGHKTGGTSDSFVKLSKAIAKNV